MKLSDLLKIVAPIIIPLAERIAVSRARNRIESEGIEAIIANLNLLYKKSAGEKPMPWEYAKGSKEIDDIFRSIVEAEWGDTGIAEYEKRKAQVQ